MGCKLEGLGIVFFRSLPDSPDLVRGVLEKEAAHLGHYVRVILIMQLPQPRQG